MLVNIAKRAFRSTVRVKYTDELNERIGALAHRIDASSLLRAEPQSARCAAHHLQLVLPLLHQKTPTRRQRENSNKYLRSKFINKLRSESDLKYFIYLIENLHCCPSIYVETRKDRAQQLQCGNLPLFNGGGAERESVADSVEEDLLARRHEVVEQ